VYSPNRFGGVIAEMKRYLINAAQMSIAVTLGVLLSPVILAMDNVAAHAFRHW
jgi:hypothetical protein